ncbi:hypothetical protein ISS86_00825 [Candidatus Microgenomates bacterium]|nr:hypothetical protein [Candidatus Microgenomates bacterium]
MKRVLILTSQTGGGHESIAQAVKQALRKQFKVEVYDGLPRLGAKLYGYVHLYLPAFYNLAYRLTDNPLMAKILHFFSSLFSLPALKKIPFEDYDLIFSIQPLLISEVSRLIGKQKFAILINDPISVHQAWICPRADLIFVATQEAKKLCLQKGLPPEKIIISGFPIRKQFFKKLPTKEILRQELGLKPNQFTVFVGGSGYGVRETKEIVKHLQNQNIQIIVVCGRNKTLRKTLTKKENLKVFGFVKNMAKLMKACDLIVGKAGPNLLFESVALGIPFLATGYPPEQEKGNMELIKKRQIGFVEENPKKAAVLIKKLARNPRELERLVPNIRKLAKIHQNTSKIIASKISQLLKNSNILN